MAKKCRKMMPKWRENHEKMAAEFMFFWRFWRKDDFPQICTAPRRQLDPEGSGVPKIERKSKKNRCKNDVRKSGVKMMEKGANMVSKLIQNQSKIHTKIDSKIDAKFVVQKSIKNPPLERQRVAKVTSPLQRLEVSGLEGSPGSIENRTLWPKDPPQVIPTRRWAEGPANSKYKAWNAGY